MAAVTYSNSQYLVDQQIVLIKTKGLIPTSQQTFQTQDFLNLLNDEMQIGVVPFILKNRSEYFVTPVLTPIVSKQNLYSIPTRAIGGKIRELSYIDTNGNYYDVPQIFEEDLPFFNNSNVYLNAYQFYFQGNNAVIVPTPQSSSNGNLLFTIYQRPNYLVSAASCAQITAINTSTQTVTVQVVPSTFTSGTVIDFVNGTPGFECRGINNTLASVTVAGAVVNLTFGSVLPTTLQVGDWVALQGQTPVPQIPLELFPMLNQRVVVKIMEAQGDAAGLASAQAKLMEIEKACEHLISQRSDGNPKKLINRYSPLRSNGSRGFTRY